MISADGKDLVIDGILVWKPRENDSRAVLGLYGFFVSKPWVVGENSFAVAPTSYFGVVWVYLVSLKYKYHVLSCLSGNILAVLYLTRKNKNSMANGMILPTAVYAVVLVAVRLL